MKVLYIDYHMFGKEDIIEAFQLLGNEVSVVDYPLQFGENSDATEKALYDELEKEYDLVFTTNYYVLVSSLCDRKGIKYLSWTYDSPRIALYDRSILNPCNYAFTFDSDEYRTLRKKGAATVYYMPLGVNIRRTRKLKITRQDRQSFSAEVGLVASLIMRHITYMIA